MSRSARHSAAMRPHTATLRMAYHWHRSLYLYHRKNIAPRCSAITNAGIYAGILVSLVAKVSVLTLRRLWTRPAPS